MADEIQLVVFVLQQEDTVCEYGVPITQVQEIIPIAKTTKLPQAPDFVEGIINLRGRIIPIIDLKKRFQMGASELTSDTQRGSGSGWSNSGYYCRSGQRGFKTSVRKYRTSPGVVGV